MQGDFQPVVTNANATIRSESLVLLLPPVFSKVCQKQKKLKANAGGLADVLTPAAILAWCALALQTPIFSLTDSPGTPWGAGGTFLCGSASCLVSVMDSNPQLPGVNVPADDILLFQWSYL